jgi:DNA-binding MarR family transcriptional regulator
MARERVGGQVERLDFLFPQMMRRIFTQPGERFHEPGVSFAQLRLLMILEMEQEGSMSRLAGMLSVTKPTVTALSDGLVKQKMIWRRRSPDDRRVVQLGLRPAGRQVLERMRRFRKGRFAHVLERLTHRDRADLVAAFQTIYDLLEKLGQPRPEMSR